MTGVAPTVNDSNKNAFSHLFPLRRKLSYQLILRTLIFATPELCRLNVVAGPYTLSKGSLLSMVHMGSRWVLQCHMIPTILHLLTDTPCLRLVPIKVAPSTMIEVLHSLPILKIK